MSRWQNALLGGALALLLVGCGRPTAQPPSATEVQEFHAAVRDGDAEIVGRLIRVKPQLVNAPNAQGETPLKVATQGGNEELAELLRKNGGHE